MRSWPDWQWQYSRAVRFRASIRGKIPPRCVPGDTPTAQVCSRCGHEELVLARDLRPAWTCPECGAKHDRKANGAQNVLETGKDILAKQEQSFVTKAKRSREKKRAAKPKNSEKQNDWQL